jgi:hypothetical protein
MQETLPRRLAAEGLGTGFLLATVIGFGIMAERPAGGSQALAPLQHAATLVTRPCADHPPTA